MYKTIRLCRSTRRVLFKLTDVNVWRNAELVAADFAAYPTFQIVWAVSCALAFEGKNSMLGTVVQYRTATIKPSRFLEPRESEDCCCCCNEIAWTQVVKVDYACDNTPNRARNFEELWGKPVRKGRWTMDRNRQRDLRIPFAPRKRRSSS